MQPAPNRKDIIFYDGTCGICHRFVRWTLTHDPAGKFQLSPLQGETIKLMLSAEARAKLPDSSVLITEDGALLTKSAATQYVLEKLGMRSVAGFLSFFPRWLADFGYDLIAKTRYVLFGRNQGDMCPVLPPELRDRFLP